MEVEKNNTVNGVSKELAKHLCVYENSNEVIKDINNSIENVTIQMEDTKKSLEQVNYKFKEY
jgi:hypothetical protein